MKPSDKRSNSLKLQWVLALALSAGGCTHSNTQPEPVIEADDALGCLRQMVPELARHPTIVSTLMAYNLSGPAHVSDEIWAALPLDAQQVQRLLHNPSAELITHAIEQTSWQGEGFLIGADGGLAAITDKTSDYWQDDEAQFSRSIDLPAGETYVEQQVVDQSAEMMLIKVATPVYNPDTSQPIGVLMVGFDQFVVEFRQPCKISQFIPELAQNKKA